MGSSWHLGFDIGGTKCAVILGQYEPALARPVIVERRAFKTNEWEHPSEALAAMAATAVGMVKKHGLLTSDIASAGISCGGPLDSVRGVVLSPPNLPGWDEVPVVGVLSEELSIPVKLQNDANACALAEWRWGAAQGADTAVFLTYGTGLGAGLIIGGRLHEGRIGLAGEVGHWQLASEGPVGYGKSGSFEGFCSGGGMARLASSLLTRRAASSTFGQVWSGHSGTSISPDVKALATAAREGDPLAREVFETAARKLGQGLALIIDLLNPEVIVIGSIFTRCEDLLRPGMECELSAQALPAALAACRVVPAALGEQIGDYAALAVGSL
ncbi:ROK family protein [Ruficoccus amylovorans]|uniref:ROK family protein n=2 Tax=Ruficoccus amylovorans TaxID=1804625 RepID=A0A842HAT9_9BACT|nr:ROK family protein [Ruficoccus amylovorans]